MSLRVLTLSTLFPDMTRPNYGVFVERQARELASRQEAHVTVIAPIGIPPWPLNQAKRYDALRHLPQHERWKDLIVHRPRFPIIPAFGGATNVATIYRAILPLVRRLHGERPFDVIDASFFYPDGPVAQRLARELGIPYSVKARGADIHYWGRRRNSARAIRAVGRNAAGLLAVSKAMRRTMAKLGMPEDKIRVHYTGVDLDRFGIADQAEAKARLEISGPLILSVGALIPSKGQDLLIRALPQIPGAILLLAGHGEERTALSALAREVGMTERVGFLGAVPQDQLPALYAAADVMALPSSSEGLANAWVEALASGTPVVICDVGGAKELIDRPEAGRIVERDVNMIAAAIHDILDNPPDRAAVRETALRFTWKANGDALLAHLQEITGKKD
jgi:glycosyltransferase involved in cell wall biosynthesis